MKALPPQFPFFPPSQHRCSPASQLKVLLTNFILLPFILQNHCPNQLPFNQSPSVLKATPVLPHVRGSGMGRCGRIQQPSQTVAKICSFCRLYKSIQHRLGLWSGVCKWGALRSHQLHENPTSDCPHTWGNQLALRTILKDKANHERDGQGVLMPSTVSSKKRGKVMGKTECFCKSGSREASLLMWDA